MIGQFFFKPLSDFYILFYQIGLLAFVGTGN